MSKLSKVLFVTFMLMLFPIVSQATCNILIDGQDFLCYDANGVLVEPFVSEGTTYVPVRAIATAFDVTISWDQETKTVHIGTVGGTPVLNDHINIYVDGEEFICLDANQNKVYPILQNGTTYLPIRGISQLFGKSISWDQTTQTATLTTPPSEAAVDFLKNAVSNTAALADLKAFVSIDGSISYNGEYLASISNSNTETYSPVGFSLSQFLPTGYENNISYNGNGEYFITVPSDRFSSNPDLQKKLFQQNTPATFSNLFIYLSTKNAYITEVSINFTGLVKHNSLTFNETFIIKATLQYPDTFTFPLTPYPDKELGEDETHISADASETSDSTLISKLIMNYIDYSVSGRSKELVGLLHSDDYNTLFYNKSTSQLNTELSTLKKNLTSMYQSADGTYTLDSLVYTNPTDATSSDNTAKAYISINFSEGDEQWANEYEILLIKKDGQWYLDLSVITSLF